MGNPDRGGVPGGQGQPAGEAATPDSAGPEGTAPSRGKRAWSAAGRLASIVVLTVMVFAALVLIIVPRVTGSHTYTVLTNSMAPKYPPGTFLVARPAAYSELTYGDIVTFQLESGKPAVETHRIVGFGSAQTGEKTLITKGDNNDVDDPNPVREVQVQGKLLYAVPYAGFLANAVGNSDRGLWLSVGAVVLIGYGIVLILKTVRGLRRGTKAAP
ncbi:signal peptidase I [Arthrobacter sp. NPDC056691]|uniref:signal peptidase I n=1 Tax=Arthrobacter sp. NPDC056691 TaxID=3345913 RepID=UPI0036701C5E